MIENQENRIIIEVFLNYEKTMNNFINGNWEKIS